MQITSRFTVAVHTLLAIYKFNKDYKTTSDFIATSVNVNPVVIRRTLQGLKAAGFVEETDVYVAMESLEGDLFHFHENPNPLCPVGRNIHRVLDKHLQEAQKAMEDKLKSVKLSDLTNDIDRLISNE